MSKRTLAPVDQWLTKEGYFRKPTPRDPTCLFRAISEQVYHTQHFHLRVRQECVDFMRKHRDLFMNYITTPFDYYLKEMEGYTSWGGQNEIRAMSMLYKRDVVIFHGETQICDNFTNYNFKNGLILLCHTEPKQYEPVYPMAFVQSAAYCQSIVYEVVYKNIYKMANIKDVADEMLQKRKTDEIRHDRFFHKENLDIRKQLIEDLYKKVNERDDRSDHDVRTQHGLDEVQSDWKGGAPIPFKVAKALASDYYRNIELDIWHELKREVKSAGWNRYNNNELQVGGKCLIEININDLEQCDRNNNKKLLTNSSDFGINENGIESNKQPEKLKQGSMGLEGYIQEMTTKKEPVLVFIRDLGEKKFVPYDALKPYPVVRKNKPRNYVAVNRNHTVNSDSSRRWKKSYNSFPRKKKDAISVVHGISNTNKNIVTTNDDNSNDNTVDSDNINDINKSRTDEQNNELSTLDQCQTENQSVEGCCNHATNEETNLSTMVTHSQSTLPNSASHKVEEEPKKAVFRKMNFTPRNKAERSNSRNDLQNSSKLKALDENYSSPYNSNQQINMSGSPNISYVVAENGSTYPVYSYVQPGNYGEHNQVDHTFANNFFYNLHLLHLEDNFRTVNPPYYGPMIYGSSHSVQPSGNVHAMNNMPCMQDEMEHFVNGMQNCSLTYSEGTGISDETSNTSHWNMNGAQNTGQPKQGSRSLSGKDSSYQIVQKGKQTGTAKGTGNRARNRQYNRGSMYSTQQQQQQHSGQHYGGTSMHTYDTRRNDSHVVQQNRSWDPILHQVAPNTTNTYASPQYAPPPGVFSPPIPYHELSSHYPTNDGILGNPSPYYPPGNGGFVSVPPYLPPQHVDAAENTTVSSYPQRLYSPTESLYPQTHPQTAGQPMLYSQPMMYPQPMQYHALLPPPVQEQWNPMLGSQPYVQCAASSAPIPPQGQIAEPSSNGQCTTTPKGSH